MHIHTQYMSVCRDQDPVFTPPTTTEELQTLTLGVKPPLRVQST